MRKEQFSIGQLTVDNIIGGGVNAVNQYVQNSVVPGQVTIGTQANPISNPYQTNPVTTPTNYGGVVPNSGPGL